MQICAGHTPLPLYSTSPLCAGEARKYVRLDSTTLTMTFVSVSLLRRTEWTGRTEGGMTSSSYTFTNKNRELIDVILGLTAISLYNKRNKVDVQLTSKGNFYCTSKISFLIGMSLDQEKEDPL